MRWMDENQSSNSFPGGIYQAGILQIHFKSEKVTSIIQLSTFAKIKNNE